MLRDCTSTLRTASERPCRHGFFASLSYAQRLKSKSRASQVGQLLRGFAEFRSENAAGADEEN